MNTFDDAMLAYMDHYYAGADPQAEYYHSMSDPRNVLHFHKKLIIRHPNDIRNDFEQGRCWLFDDDSTSEQLIEKALGFKEGFLDFLTSFPAENELLILDQIAREKAEHEAFILKAARSLAIELHFGAVLPRKPEHN